MTCSVLCGRGSAANNHIGNIRFRDIVQKYQDRYRSACKSDKPIVALEIVLRWKSMSPPGRFLSKKSSSKKGGKDSEDISGGWYEIPDEQASRKVAQRLRERSTAFAASQLRRREREERDMSTIQRQSPLNVAPVHQGDELEEEHQVPFKSSSAGPQPLSIAAATSSLDSFLKGISTIDTSIDTSQEAEQDFGGIFSFVSKDGLINKHKNTWDHQETENMNMYSSIERENQNNDSLPLAADLTAVF